MPQVHPHDGRPRGRGAIRRDPPEPLWRAQAVAKDQPKVLPHTQCGHEAGMKPLPAPARQTQKPVAIQAKPAVWRPLEHRTQPRNISAGVTPNFHFDDLVHRNRIRHPPPMCSWPAKFSSHRVASKTRRHVGLEGHSANRADGVRNVPAAKSSRASDRLS